MKTVESRHVFVPGTGSGCSVCGRKPEAHIYYREHDEDELPRLEDDPTWSE